MKNAGFLIVLFFLLACGGNQSQKNLTSENSISTESKAESKKEDRSEHLREVDQLMNDGQTDSILNVLNGKYADVPIIAPIQKRKLYIVASEEYNYGGPARFSGKIKYGLVDETMAVLLPLVYDKISNPDLMSTNCMEIFRDGMVGLYNYQEQMILKPQFEFFMPHSNSTKIYGLKSQTWYEIDTKDFSMSPAEDYSFRLALKSLSFDVDEVENWMYSSHYFDSDYSDYVGYGVVISPSFVAKHDLLEESYNTLIFPAQFSTVETGTDLANFKNKEVKSISDQILAFFYSVYGEGLDARGYKYESAKLVVLDEKSQQTTAVNLFVSDEYPFPCKKAGYRFVNDSILEVNPGTSPYHSNEEERLHLFETTFKYYLLTSSGHVKALETNRHFNFTKFILLDEEHFFTCLADPLDVDDYGDGNILLMDHYTLEDLDIMRNEIFADYGYRFTSEKWQDYFSKKSWYEPKYDQVDDQLTDIDRANIKTILKVKEKLQKDEDRYLNKRKGVYYAAG